MWGSGVFGGKGRSSETGPDMTGNGEGDAVDDEVASPAEEAGGTAAHAEDPQRTDDAVPAGGPGDPERSDESDGVEPEADEQASAEPAEPEPEPAEPEPAEPEPAADRDVSTAAAAQSAGDLQGVRDPRPENVGTLLPLALQLLPAKEQRRSFIAGAARLILLSAKSRTLPRAVGLAVATGWAVAVGLLLSLLLAALAQAEHPATAAPLIWLAAHHAAVATDTGVVTLLPLGLLLAVVLPLRRAGSFLAVQARDRPLRPTAAAALVAYTAAAGFAAAAWGGGHFSPIGVLPWAAACAMLAGWWGIRSRRPRPGISRPLLAGTVRAAGVPLVLGAVLLVAAAATSWQSIAGMQQQVAQTPGEHIGLVLLQIAYVPNLIIWAGAYTVGAGISFGADTVSPYSDAAPLLPDLPVLQAVATSAPNATAMLPIAVAVGAALAAMAMNRIQPIHELGRRIILSLAMSAGVVVAWFVLGQLAGGSVGDGRLDYIGPAPGTAFLAGLATLAGTLLWALLPTIASDAKPVAHDLKGRVVRSKDTLVGAAEARRR